MSEQFTHCSGYGGEDEGTEDGVSEGCGGESDAAFASDTSRSWGSRLHRDVGRRCYVWLSIVDELNSRHVGIILVILWRRVDRPCWASCSSYRRILRRVVVIGFAIVVPICEDVQVEFNLHLFYHVLIAQMVVVVIVLGLCLYICGYVFASSWLDLLQPLLLSW
jgi:hypothetical protein